jgi:hypothetical protein
MHRYFGLDSRRCQIFWEVAGPERGPLSLVSATEELLGRKSSASGLESREYGRHADHVTPLYPQKLALTSPTSGGRSVDIVSSRTQATELFNDVSVGASHGNLPHVKNFGNQGTMCRADDQVSTFTGISTQE